MPVHCRTEGDVVVIEPVGPHTTAELIDAWLAAERDAAFPQPLSRVRICVDTRQSPMLAQRSVAELRATSEWFIARAEQTSERCAWVTRPGVQYGLARMMAAWIDFKGFRAHVTTDLDAALRWLREAP
jgi:hypothetical protein